MKIINKFNKDNWEVVETGTEVHCIPLNDLFEHSLIINACQCEARIEWDDEDGNPLSIPVVVHNSYDGRELIEEDLDNHIKIK